MSEWNHFYCKDCGHLVVAKETPAPIHWNDGHTCSEWIPDSENKEDQNDLHQ